MGVNILKLHLLGPPQIELGDEPIDGFVSEKALLLLGYLAVQHNRQARDHLSGFFWGEMPGDRAKANLRMAIYNLQQLFPGYLQANRLYVSFNHELDYWLDVEQLEQGLAAIPPSFPPPIVSLQAALSLYRGEFMEGIHLSESPELEEWLLVERERLRRIALEGFQRYADALITAGQYAQAVQTIQQVLRLEPWHEPAHRQMMLVLARTGDFTGALEQFEVCRRTLAEELGVEPMAETTRLYQRIREVRDLPFRHNLPVLSSQFFGREDAIQDLSRLLHDPHNRLVTITGPGGAGKSLLALEVASHFVNVFLHGVYLVSLGSLESGDDLPSPVGHALGMSFTGKEDPERQVLQSLAQKELLLVLDNGEQVPTLADFVSKILQAAPQVKILATVQERLDLREEWVYEVGGLTYPAKETGQTWSKYSALQLFMERMRRMRYPYQPAADEWPHIVRICQLVEGLPLGIELAAACMRNYTCAEIADKLEQDIDILAATWRNAPARQRSMRAVFDHTWSLLTGEEQRVLRRAAVFRGSFTPEAARQVADASLETLHALVEHSLLYWTASQDGRKRFSFHALLRQYAFERLIEAEEENAIRDRHLVFFLNLAEEARQALDGARAQGWLVRLEDERDNFRGALDWAETKAEHLLTGLRLASALTEFWNRRGYLKEGRTRLAVFLTRSDKYVAAMLPAQKIILARALCAAGSLALSQGQLEDAHRYFSSGLDLSRTVQNMEIEAEALLGLGATAWTQADYASAQGFLEESLHRYEEVGSEHGRAMALRRLGQCSRIQGKFDQAITQYSKSQKLYQRTGDQRGIAQTLEGMGIIARLNGDLQQAQSLAEESLTIRRSLSDTPGISYSLFNLGAIAYESGDTDQATIYLEDCLSIRRNLGDRVGVAAALTLLGDVALDQAEIQQARLLFEESLAQRRELGDAYGSIEDLRGLSQAYQKMNNASLARSSLEEALALSGQLHLPRITAAVLRDLANLCLHTGDQAQSIEFALESFDLSMKQNDPLGIIESLEVFADISRKSGQLEAAARLLACAGERREANSLILPPREQAEASRRQQAIRADLGEVAFAQAWDEGRQLSIEHAIEQILSTFQAGLGTRP